MKINISSDAKSDLTKEEYKYLILLEFHQGLEKVINEARTKFLGWPSCSLPFTSSFSTQNINGNYPDSPPEKSDLQRATFYVMKSLKIPLTLYTAIERLVGLGLINDINSPIFVFGYRATNIRGLIRSTPIPSLKYPTITLYRSMTKEKFIDMIKNYWPQIKKAMEELDNSAGVLAEIKKISIRDIETDLFIYRERKTNRLKYKLLAERLHMEEQTIRQRYSIFNKLLIKLGFIGKNVRN